MTTYPSVLVFPTHCLLHFQHCVCIAFAKLSHKHKCGFNMNTLLIPCLLPKTNNSLLHNIAYIFIIQSTYFLGNKTKMVTKRSIITKRYSHIWIHSHKCMYGCVSHTHDCNKDIGKIPLYKRRKNIQCVALHIYLWIVCFGILNKLLCVY